jgi:hypothetical protein
MPSKSYCLTRDAAREAVEGSKLRRETERENRAGEEKFRRRETAGEEQKRVRSRRAGEEQANG